MVFNIIELFLDGLVDTGHAVMDDNHEIEAHGTEEHSQVSRC